MGEEGSARDTEYAVLRMFAWQDKGVVTLSGIALCHVAYPINQ